MAVGAMAMAAAVMGGGEDPFKLHPFKLHLQPLPCTLPRRQQPLHDSTLCGDEPVVQCWRSQLSVDALVASCIAFQVLGTLRSDRLLAAWCAASALGRARTASGESAASESLHRSQGASRHCCSRCRKTMQRLGMPLCKTPNLGNAVSLRVPWPWTQLLICSLGFGNL